MRTILPSGQPSAGRFIATLGLAALLAGAVNPARAQELVRRYTLIELQAEQTDAQSRAYSLNNTGEVVGWVEDGNNRHAAQWHNRVITDLNGTVHFELLHPFPSYTEVYAEAYDISDGGQVVGTARTTTPSPPCAASFPITTAFMLRPAVLTDLATPYPGDALTNLRNFGDVCDAANLAFDSAAVGISNTNYVVGWADLPGQIMHAFLLQPENGAWVVTNSATGPNLLLVDLGTLAASDPTSSATAVNDAGQVTGFSYTLNDDGTAGYHAFLVTPADTDNDGEPNWFAGNGSVNTLMSDLGTLGGPNSWGRDISNAGDVVGESDLETADSQHFTHAFIWHAGTMSDLGTLHTDPTSGFSAASAINTSGVIVGWAENEQSDRRAFIYEDGQMTDLNTQLYLRNEDGSTITPSIVLTEARDVNDDGVIVGWGTIKGSNGTRTRGFLLNPTLIDPALLEPNEPNQAAPTPVDDGTTNNNPDYSSTPDFGPPDVNGATDEQGTATPTPAAPAFCGAQGLTLVPLTLLLLGWRRRR
jgi:probable HAF family extracellular repeat protein